MKRGNKCLLPVKFNINLNSVARVDFIFKQGSFVKQFQYPSDVASRRGDENIIDLIWEPEDTMRLDASCKVSMDTRVYLNGTQYQPDTTITCFNITGTLFKEVAENA